MGFVGVYCVGSCKGEFLNFIVKRNALEVFS